MKKINSVVLCLFICAKAFSQITSVDSAYTGASVAFTGPAGKTTYTWTTDSVDINQAPDTFTSAAVSGISTPNFSTVSYDNGTWYTFITNNSGTLTRLTYAGSPNGSYTQSTVGSYGTANKLEGIEVLKDEASGNWYAFLVNNDVLFRLSFGTSLANAPTSTSWTLSALAYAHQLSIDKIGNQWIGFVGNRSGTITRLDFGTSITNAPTATAIPNVGSAFEPSYFALHQEGGNWYMLVANLTSNTISRYSFGSNIQNNSPTGVSLGNPGSLLGVTRTIMILQDCNQLVAYVLVEGGSIVKLNFNGSIVNAPTASIALNSSITGKNAMVPYFVDNNMYVNMISFGSKMYRAKFLSFPAYDTTRYYNDSFTYSFPTTGTKNITLYTNFGNFMGTANAYCKSLAITLGISDPHKAVQHLALTPNPATDYVQFKFTSANAADVNVQIVDVTGRRVFTKNYGRQTNRSADYKLDVSELPHGLYLVEINDGNNCAIGKVVK